MYQIKINDKEFAVKRNQSGLTINDEAVAADIVKVGESVYHVISNNRSYNAAIVNFNSVEKTAVIKVNGNTYNVTSKDQFDILLEQMGLNNLKAGTIGDLKAPMPGMVLKVLVNDNDTVQKGNSLFILEAMKMENIIKAPADATVKTVKIIPGDKVEKGQVLIVFS